MADAPDISPTIASAAAPPLSLSCTPERRAVPGGAVGRVHLLLEVSASAAPGPRPPLNVCLLLDRSGSMDGAALDAAKAACMDVVDALGPDDFLSVAAFGDEADVLVPARRVTHPALLKDYIARVQSGGRANLSDGLAAACGQVASVQSPHTVNRVLLLSDGEPSAGPRDPAGILAQADQQRARGISVSAIGLGPDYGEELLTGLAQRGGGNFYGVPRPEGLTAAFGQETDALRRTVARSVRLRLHLPRGASVRQIYGRQPTFGQRTVEISLPDPESGTSLSSLWEIELAPRPAAPYRIAVAEVLYEDAASGKPQKQTADAVLDFLDAADITPPADPRVEGEAAAARAALSLEETARKLRAGHLDPAAARAETERVQDALLAAGQLSPAHLVTEALQDMDGGPPFGKALLALAFALGQGRARLPE